MGGIWAPSAVSTESMTYLPTSPVLFASPSRRLFCEFKRIRTVSPELAARTTTLPRTLSSRPVVLSINSTPAALPSAFKSTSRACAFGRMSRFPVASAGGRWTVVLW